MSLRTAPLLIVALVPACSSSDAASSRAAPAEDAAVILAPAPELRWERNVLTWTEGPSYRDAPELRVDLAFAGDRALVVEARFRNVRYDTTLAFGDHTDTGGHDKTGVLTALAPDLAAVPIERGHFGDLVVDTPLVVTLVGHEPALAELPPLRPDATLHDRLGRVAESPLVLVEPDGAAAPDTVAILGKVGYVSIEGTGRTLADVDWVVVSSQTDEATDPTKRCSGYLGTFRTIEVTHRGVHARFIDRRTGETLAEKTLRGPRGCPMLADVDRSGAAYVHPAHDAVTTWARAELARRTRTR